MQRDAIDFGTVNIPSLFGKYFVTTLLGMVSMSAVTAIDGIFIGHGVGSDGIAAVNICVPVWMIFTGLGLMAGAGSSVVASIHLARGKVKAARLNVTQAILFVTIIAALVAGLIMTFPETTARMLGSSEHLMPLVLDYLLWIVPALPFQMWLSVSLFIIRLDGAPQYAMWCSVITAIINTMLDWLFIFPLDMGVKGAAIATGISIVIGGRISTGNDDPTTSGSSNSFIDDISLEWRLDDSGTRYIRIFHNTNFDSMLDGEITETGAGIVLRKKVSKLGELFIFRNRKKQQRRNEPTTTEDK